MFSGCEMDIWNNKKWEKYYNRNIHRVGLRVRYEKTVSLEVKRAVNEFISWLRKKYIFPKRVNIYVNGKRRIKSMYGDFVCGTFFRPIDRDVEPYIRIATGDYAELLETEGKDNALASFLWTVAHELTHYFQWLNDLNLTFIGEERQASVYANKILEEYSQTRDHP